MNSEIYPKPKRKRKHERNPNTKQNSTGYQGNKKSYNQDKRFKYGNYNRYYGYRNKNNENDQRIELLQKTWFENKTCLDIGCNVGHLTLWIAKHFQPFKIKGVDIDPELVKAAKSNVVHYIDENSVKVKGNSSNSKSRPDKVNRNNVNENKFATLEQLISNTNKDLENTRDANTNGDFKKWTDSKEKGKKIEEAKIKYEDKDCGKNSLNPLDQSTLLDGRIFVCNKDSNKASDQSVGKEHREEGTVCGNDPENPPGPPTLSSNKSVICNGDSNKDETSNKDSSISQQNKFPYNVSFITVSEQFFDSIFELIINTSRFRLTFCYVSHYLWFPLVIGAKFCF